MKGIGLLNVGNAAMGGGGPLPQFGTYEKQQTTERVRSKSL
jgi:hypothetical protein